MILKQYKIITTADGSPSLQHVNLEPMHSTKGAFSESLYIYLDCITQAHQKIVSPPDELKGVSVGLGLGYNEIISHGYFLKNNIKNFKLLSFESDNLLKTNFINWLQEQSTPLQDVYSQITQLTAKYFDLKPQQLKKFITKAYSSQFVINGELPAVNVSANKYNFIFYDAYSSKSSPTLWETNFLNSFLKSYTEDKAVFSTYAATSTLNFALKQNGFARLKRPGFKGKRECTLAFKTGNALA